MLVTRRQSSRVNPSFFLFQSFYFNSPMALFTSPVRSFSCLTGVLTSYLTTLTSYLTTLLSYLGMTGVLLVYLVVFLSSSLYNS